MENSDVKFGSAEVTRYRVKVPGSNSLVGTKASATPTVLGLFRGNW